ncbi:Putrescine transport ATP-binding protein PotA [Devosia sp. LC5]|uniref:ABC transporter ATP-binding protein n=1 Tax=Devosia sp. LC5 TaxID=1502724 RepID=UPI0004E37A36|nr:ABC transporter ATP-binding protein [Devosia sp. LC5]KFC69917.1 Putrescine transport ATP-binding protein PotA [Devosia sp. LC5]
MKINISDAQIRGAHVQLEGLSKVYSGGTVGVDAIDLAVAPGEILALLGPSGCGKTTTLRMIAGLITPSAGEILIDGTSIVSLPVHRRNLGMLFQNYALFPHMSVLDNVAFGLSMRGVAKAEIAERSREALRLVQLEALADRLPKALSGGQQQRVALARAIVYRPRLLLLDEPLGALDKKLRESMQLELRQLCAQLGLTMVLVTHDQEEALTLADRIAVMRGGRIEQVGLGREVYEHPISAFVANFIGTSNLVDARIVSRDGDVTVLETDQGQSIHSTTRHGFALGDAVTVSIRPEHVTLAPSGASASGPNSLEGLVTQAVFKGQNLAIHLRVPGGADFVCTIPVAMTGSAVPAAGQIWRMTWPADRTIVVSRA